MDKSVLLKTTYRYLRIKFNIIQTGIRFLNFFSYIQLYK